MASIYKLINNEKVEKTLKNVETSPDLDKNTQKLKVINEIVQKIMKKFYNDINRQDRIENNWPDYKGIKNIKSKIISSILNYYEYRSKLKPEQKKLLAESSFEERYNIITGLTKNIKDPIDRLVIILVDTLKVNSSENFMDQLTSLIFLERYKENKELDVLIKNLKAALTIAGALFAIEYRFRKNENKAKWDEAAYFLTEFYKEVGYEAVQECIEEEYISEDIKKIYNTMLIEKNKIKTLVGLFKNIDGVKKVDYRFKSLHSFNRKINKKLKDKNEDLIKELITDVNGIRIIFEDEAWKDIKNIIKQIVFITKTQFQSVTIEKIELHGYDEKIYDFNNTFYIKKHNGYKAIHLLLNINDKKLEMQLVSYKDYLRNFYSKETSHINYKIPESTNYLEKLIILFTEKLTFILPDNRIIKTDPDLNSIEVMKGYVVGEHKEAIIRINNLTAIAVAILNPKSDKNIEIYVGERNFQENNNKIFISI